MMPGPVVNAHAPHAAGPASTGSASPKERLVTQHELTTIQDCEDFVSGCLFMGTGGGGGVDWGMGMLREGARGGPAAAVDRSRGHPRRRLDLHGLRDGIDRADRTTRRRRAIEALGLTDRIGHDAMAQAVRELTAYTGKPISVIVAVGARGRQHARAAGDRRAARDHVRRRRLRRAGDPRRDAGHALPLRQVEPPARERRPLGRRGHPQGGGEPVHARADRQDAERRGLRAAATRPPRCCRRPR